LSCALIISAFGSGPSSKDLRAATPIIKSLARTHGPLGAVSDVIVEASWLFVFYQLGLYSELHTRLLLFLRAGVVAIGRWWARHYYNSRKFSTQRQIAGPFACSDGAVLNESGGQL